MEINLIADNSVSAAPAGFTAAIQAAAGIFDKDFPGNYAVNITYGWGTYDNQPDTDLTNVNSGAFSLGGCGIGTVVSYATARSWLTANATQSSQLAAFAYLPANSAALPGGTNKFWVSSAEEKALGVYSGSSDAVDGSIGFNVGDASSPASYWEEAALCEIAHALGWLPDEFQGTGTIAQLFRYSSPGQYQWTAGQPAYFSIDGGKTNLANFATSFDTTLFTNLGDNDPLNVPFSLTQGAAPTLTNFDIEVLNVIGFGEAFTPQPAPQLTIADAVAIPNSLQQTVTGTINVADAGLKISLYDGANLLGTTTANSTGGWTAFITLSRAGLHALTAKATALGGNVGTSNSVYLATVGGETITFADASGDGASLYNAAIAWDSVTGSNGKVFLNSAGATVFGGADAIYFWSGSGNAANLASTGSAWDIVTSANGAVGTVALNSAGATVIGGGDTVNFWSGYGNVANLAYTGSAWDTVNNANGAVGTVDLTSAGATVFGGGDTVYFWSGYGNAASLANTGNAWDTVYNANGAVGTVDLTSAGATVIGGGDAVYFWSGYGNAANLAYTGSAWDTVSNANGAVGTVDLTNAGATVIGGGDTVYFWSGYGNAASLANTGSVWDTVYNANGAVGTVYLTSAGASVIGGGDTVYFSSGYGNVANLAYTGSAWDTVYNANGAVGTVDLTSAGATVIGGGDTVNFWSGYGNVANLAYTGSAWDTVSNANGAVGTVELTNAGAAIYGGGDTVIFANGASNGASLSGSNYALTFNQKAFGLDTVIGYNSTDSLSFASADQGHLTISQSGANTLIKLDAGDILTLTNVQAASLGAFSYHS